MATGKRQKDPSAPKPALSAYMLFAQSERKKVKEDKPELSFSEIGKELGSRWKHLPNEEKEVFIKQAETEKQRHEKEYRMYYDSGKMDESEQVLGNSKKKRIKSSKKISAYQLFSADQRAILKEKALSFGDMVKAIAERWKILSDEEKNIYVGKANIANNSAQSPISKENQAPGTGIVEEVTDEDFAGPDEPLQESNEQIISEAPDQVECQASASS